VGVARVALAACLPLLRPLLEFARVSLLLAMLVARMVQLQLSAGDLRRTRFSIAGVGAAEAMQALLVQFDDALHAFEQRTIMADHQQPAAPLRKLPLQQRP